MQSTLQREYQIAPELLRRCCWYTIFGAITLGAIYYWVARFVENRGVADIATGCIMFAVLAVVMVLPLRWKLRVEQFGVSWRLLFGWDSWPWCTLESGRILKLHPFTLYDPDRPWWRRKLRLGVMAAGDVKEVMSLINLRYQLPSPPALPVKLVINELSELLRTTPGDNRGF